MATSAQPHVPKTVGKYQIVELVKALGYVTYYRAKTHGVAGFEKIVLLSVISLEFSNDPLFVANLLEETRKTATLAHANVCQIFDFGQDEITGQYFIASEHVSGHTLKDVLEISQRLGKPLPIDLAIWIAAEIAKGIDYAHRRKNYEFENLNIVFGNLRPSSVIINFDGTVKINDFGLCCALTKTKLAEKTWRAETIRYFAPEVAKTGILTQAGDIFSLGLLFYEMLTGKEAYPGNDRDVVYKKVTSAAIEPLSSIGNFPREVVRIVESMLVPNPDGRINSTGNVFDELVSFIYRANVKAEPRLLAKFLSEIGLSKHRSQQPSNKLLQQFTAFNLRKKPGRKLESGIHTSVSFDPDSQNLPLWIEYPLRDVIQGAASEDWETMSQLVLLIDDPEPFNVCATDRWACLTEQHALLNAQTSTAAGTSVSLEGVVVIQTNFNAHTIINPAIDLCEQFLYPLAKIINDEKPTIEGPVYGYRRRAFAIDVLLAAGLELNVAETLKSLWLTGCTEENVEITPHTLTEAICSAMLLAMYEVCSFSNYHAIVWFMTNIERLDSLSIMVLARLSHLSAYIPVFAILSTNDEKLVHATMNRDELAPDRLHTINIEYNVKKLEVPTFDSLDQTSKDLILLLSISERPFCIEELVSLTQLDGDTVQQLIQDLEDQHWLRKLQGNRWMICLPSALSHVLESCSHELVSKAAIRLREWYVQNLDTPVCCPRRWQPIDVFWPRLHALIGEVNEMIYAAEFFSKMLQNFGLYGVLSRFYYHFDETLVSANLSCPTFRNTCLLKNSSLKIFMFDLETAKEQIRVLGSRIEENQNTSIICSVLLLYGMIAFLNDQSDRAKDLFRQCADISTAKHNPRLLALSQTFSAISRIRVDELKDATHLQLAATNLVETYGEVYFSTTDLAQIYAFGTFIHHCYRQKKLAEDNLMKLELLAHNHGHAITLCYLYFARGINYFINSNFSAAENMWRECYILSSTFFIRSCASISILGIVFIALSRNGVPASRRFLERASQLLTRAPESFLNINVSALGILANILNPDVQVDLNAIRQYFSTEFKRARKLNIPNDITRIKYISSFAPPDAVPDELRKLPMPDFSDPVTLLRLILI